MDASITGDVVVGGVLAALILALWRDVRSLGGHVARLEGWLERDRSAANDLSDDSRRRHDHGR